MSSTNSSKKNHPNDDKQPASGNKITKNSSSCNFCREKKVRCVYLSGGRCKQCINHNRECISDPQKKRGPKGPKKAAGSSTLYRTNLNLESLGEAFLRSLEDGQALQTLIQETRSNMNAFGISLTTNNEQTLPNLENLSNNEGTIFSGSSIGSSLATNDQSGLGISNVQISYSLIQSNPSNSDPISVNSTQETLPSRNFSAINNGQMLSPVIDNRQNFLRTRSPGTSRQPSPIRENRQRRREDRNHELGVGLHGNISNPNSSRSPSPICLGSLYSDNWQQNLPVSQFPEITLQDFADLRSPSPIDLSEFSDQVYYSPDYTAYPFPINYGTSNNSSSRSSPLIPFNANPQAMSMPLLGDASPFITDPQTPVSSINSPLINFTTDPQTTSTLSLELENALPFVNFMSPLELSPYVNFSTDPQDTSMSSLELGDTLPLANFTTDSQATSMSSPELEDSTSLINTTTDHQTISMDNSEEINSYLSIPPQNFMNRMR
ncbi:5452_t:CDS:1 [Dentiscutata erythropus]|uniref:5452_t:CDS:1 n=1 Tax=Dentiscutata erythropus TaxID=1348616 RepID=A0A9N8ZG91_9GLOM|nr:5452_t:CDS:1 [Dentiscutata erythropus]